MKKSILLLEIMVILASNVSFSAELTLEQQADDLSTSQDQQSQLAIAEPAQIGKDLIKFTSSNKIKELTALNYQATIDNKIAEDKKITECHEVEFYSLIIDSSIEETIIDNNQIIESTITNDIYPLDLELIRKELFKNENHPTSVKTDDEEISKPLIF